MSETDLPRQYAEIVAEANDTGLETYRETVEGVGHALDVSDPVQTYLRAKECSGNIADHGTPQNSGYTEEYSDAMAHGILRAALGDIEGHEARMPTGQEIAAFNKSDWKPFSTNPVGFRLLCRLTAMAQAEAALVVAKPGFKPTNVAMDLSGLDFQTFPKNKFIQAKSVRTLMAGKLSCPGERRVATADETDDGFNKLIHPDEDISDVRVLGICRDGRGNVVADYHYGKAMSEVMASWTPYVRGKSDGYTTHHSEEAKKSFKTDGHRIMLKEVPKE